MATRCPEKQREYKRKWCKENREKEREYGRKYREANREKGRARTRKWYEENREKALANQRKWYEENREKVLANQRKWREENPERRAAHSAVSAATRRSSLPHDVLFGGASRVEAVDYTLSFIKERLHLEEETGVPHHIDHIKPLCEGGLHVPENLQVLTDTDNLAKGPVWFEEGLTDEDIERLDQEALEFSASVTTGRKRTDGPTSYSPRLHP